jgi:hypothetical protein
MSFAQGKVWWRKNEVRILADDFAEAQSPFSDACLVALWLFVYTVCACQSGLQIKLRNQ